ncbi:GIY-YIG nuclease family protein [Erythrobacter sp.]|uniref:GIY-YIG nuclease family protein n=1 Tax=Erythrobacter sp. TaxID=1042 RepID=UPI0025E8B7CB|nr:GIY-YIG nuclease family protein [Erythrobacter sp.]
MDKEGFVYIMASRRNGTIYIGVTTDLAKRVWEHREGLIEGFTKKYGCKTLVWFERHDTIEAAITREKQMKEWQRAWKLRRIEEMNPDWNDLFELVCG